MKKPKYTILFGYLADNEGAVNEEQDVLGIKVVPKHPQPEQLVEAGVTDDFFTDLEVGSNVKFELFQVEYQEEVDLEEEIFLELIKTDMDMMLEEGLLQSSGVISFYATVNDHQDSYLEAQTGSVKVID